MRSRNIKPGSTKNEDLAELPFEARLLFIWLPMLSDAFGKLEDRPKKIHAELFPYDHSLNMDELLNSLNKSGFIIRYEVENKKYIWIPKFLDHQHPHKQERDKGSKIPDLGKKIHISNNSGTCSDNNGTTSSFNETSREDSLNPNPDPCNLIPESPIPKNGTGLRKIKISPKAGLAVSKAINGHKGALDKNTPDDSNITKKLLNELLKVHEIANDPERLLGYFLQAKRAKAKDPLGFCINLIKAPKFQVSDSCLVDAKNLIRKWSNVGISQEVREIISSVNINTGAET